MISRTIGAALNFYSTLIVISVLMSWLPLRGTALDIHQALQRITEPYLQLFRRFIPPISNLDFSPVIAIIVLGIIEQLVYVLL